MSIGTILLIILILLLVGAIPRWPYAATWGWGPSGTISLLVIVLVLLIIFGRL